MPPTGAAASAAAAASIASRLTRIDLTPAPPGALACQQDSSLRSLRTTVHACREHVVPATKKTKAQRFYELELHDTVLFPEGGGQPWDTGNIDGVQVDQVYVQDGRCLHRIPVKDGAKAPFVEGQEVVAVVDWARRFDHMQQHSAQHLFSAVAERYGYDTTTWSLGEERCNVELVPRNGSLSSELTAGKKEKNVIPSETLQKIEEEVNQAIVSSLTMTPSFAKPGTKEWEKIAAKFDPGQMPKAMRIVTIDGLDVNPCCGTHVQNLAQLRSLRVLSTELARGASRVWFVAGERVNREFSRMLKNEHALTKLLSSAPDDHASRVEKLLQFQKSTTKELKSLQKELAASIARDLVAQTSQGVVTYHRDEGDLGFLQTLLGLLGDTKKDAVFVLTAGDVRGEGLFLVAGPPEFIIAHGKSVLPIIDGKGGGGKNGIIQGKAKGLNKVDMLVEKLQKLRLQQI
ncbi:Threonyl and Alanyl tRNA synthetase second additional domain [Phytophthora infestans]|uniref:Threonyl and Alanyl tRNA synthetase second additional domain n=1 Tax=Phytophthora infestans TaxID=4787 RepID=A0A833SP57_PHYIN|nr:Threonyl and Alanyl tRNA synthetase second additional domain [Phytophthora infestans]KAF4136934.1 Threonyl and Alanyl tRNA synthetase second additional domain [Phytophthora infestans]